MTTYANKTGFPKPADGSKVWGPEFRALVDYLSQALFAKDQYFVSPDFTTANLGNAGATDRRMFPTIQEAIDAVSGTGHTGFTTINVYPGLYQENLTINKSVAIVGKTPPYYRGLGGAAGATICGGLAAQAPVITIVPPESAYVAVHFGNLSLFNQYASAAAQIANAQILKVTGQTLYGALNNYITMQGVDIRAQTWGPNNDWQYGIWLTGWNSLSMRRCHFISYRYAGGNNNGGINKQFGLHGNNANSKACTARIIDCAITQQYAGAYTLPGIFHLNNLANVTVAQSALYRDTGAYVVDGGTGTNTNSGIGTDLVNGTPATATAYGNLLGVDLAGM